MFSITYWEQVDSKLSASALKTLPPRDLNIKLKKRVETGEGGMYVGGENKTKK